MSAFLKNKGTKKSFHDFLLPSFHLKSPLSIFAIGAILPFLSNQLIVFTSIQRFIRIWPPAHPTVSRRSIFTICFTCLYSVYADTAVHLRISIVYFMPDVLSSVLSPIWKTGLFVFSYIKTEGGGPNGFSPPGVWNTRPSSSGWTIPVCIARSLR